MPGGPFFIIAALALVACQSKITAKMRQNNRTLPASAPTLSPEPPPLATTDSGAAAATPATDNDAFSIADARTLARPVTAGTTPKRMVTIDYHGEAAATNVTAAFSTGAFQFDGGAYPGTGGTCGATITGSCTLAVTLSPQALGKSTGTLTFNFQLGTKVVVSDLTFSGAAGVVIGQPTGESNPVFLLGSSWTQSVATAGGKLLLTDRGNNRILIWNSWPTSNNALPDLVLGQEDTQSVFFNTSSPSNKVFTPTWVHTDGTRIFVIDQFNNRVLIWRHFPTVSNQPADLVLGQPDFTSRTINAGVGSANARGFNNPTCVYTAAGKLFVCDYANNRVLVWNSIPDTNYAPADFALGQSDLTTTTAGTSATTLHNPATVASDGTKLVVSDWSNQRVVIFDPIPSSAPATAQHVLGQPDLTSSGTDNGGSVAKNIGSPYGLHVDETGRLFVADAAHHRITIYTAIPTTDNPTPNSELGFPDLNTAGGAASPPTSSSLNGPVGITTAGGKLVVGDYGNHRVLIWNTMPTTPGQAADVVLRQPDFTSNKANNTAVATHLTVFSPRAHVRAGRLFVIDCSNNRVLIWNHVPTTMTTAPDLVLGQPDFVQTTANNGGASAHSMSCPADAWSDGTRLYVVEYSNHRILGWRAMPTTNGQDADFVIGQADFTTVAANRGTNSPASPGLQNPATVASDGQRFWLADSGNNRILMWPSLPDDTTDMPTVVLGQPDMATVTANTGGPSATSLSNVQGLALIDGSLAAVDKGNNRILIWNTVPASSTAPADVVLGQTDMTHNAANSDGLSLASLYAPEGLSSYQGALFATEQMNNRVLIWRTLPRTNHAPADLVVGQQDGTTNTADAGGLALDRFSAPSSVEYDGDNLLVGDLWNNRIVRMPFTLPAP